jgi:hypothetical protein
MIPTEISTRFEQINMIRTYFTFTSMLQKSRMLQIRNGKGEAVPRYCEPLPTKEMQHHTAFLASSPEGFQAGGKGKN